jgi:hypothetical protein
MTRRRWTVPAVLLVISAGVFASAPALAGRLVYPLVNTGVEPAAKGYALPGELRIRGSLWYQKVTIRCENLTPRASYWTPVGSFTASRQGDGSATGWVYYDASYWGLHVDRLNPDGSAVTVLIEPY